MIKKGLAVAVILLFVGMCVVPSTAFREFKDVSTVSFDGNTLYVGGSGTGNYTTIQSAIDDSVDGDTVFVYNGEYNDYYPDGQFGYTVKINKSITLRGENKSHTIINGTGNAIAVRVSANDVVIRDFTIQNGGGSFGGGIRIMDGKIGTKIRHNIISNNTDGIFILFNGDVDIRNNVIENNGMGVYIFSSTYINFWDNIIANNEIGIAIELSFADRIGYFVAFMYYNDIRGNERGVATYNTQIQACFNNFIDNDEHLYLRESFALSQFYYRGIFKNVWNKNYWSDWDRILPRLFKGKSEIFITFPRDIPILNLPFYEFDIAPSSTRF